MKLIDTISFSKGLDHEQDFSPQNISKSCIKFDSGSWVTLTESLLAERYDHVSFTTPQGLLLLGPTSAQQGEIVKPDGTSIPSFSPQQEIM